MNEECSGDKRELPEITVHMVLGGRGLDTDECTRVVGLQPTKVWKQSQPVLASRPDLCTEAWSIGIERQHLDDTDTAFQMVLNSIWPSREKIKSYAREMALHGSFTCNVTIVRERPAYSLSPETLRRLAYFGFEVVFDIFDYSQDS